MYWLLDISGKISLQCMKVFKRKTQFCMLLTPVFPGRKRGGLKFTDEPTGNLDSVTSQDVLSLLKVTSSRFGQTVVMITHNEEIAQMADRIVRIEDGRIRGKGGEADA